MTRASSYGLISPDVFGKRQQPSERNNFYRSTETGEIVSQITKNQSKNRLQQTWDSVQRKNSLLECLLIPSILLFWPFIGFRYFCPVTI